MPKCVQYCTNQNGLRVNDMANFDILMMLALSCFPRHLLVKY